MRVESVTVEAALQQSLRKDKTMENTPLNQAAASASESATPVESPRATQGEITVLDALVGGIGFFIGCIPLAIPATCLVSAIALGEAIVAVTATLYIIGWVVAISMSIASHNQRWRLLAKGLKWGLGVSGGLGLCGIVVFFIIISSMGPI
jgi:hypothetical protein